MKNVPEPERLPNTLGELLGAALDGLIRAEQSPDYRINMNVWHRPDDQEGYYDLAPDGDPVCEVCLGGAWVAFGADVGAEKGDNLFPAILPERVAVRMVVINELREYQIVDAAEKLYGIPWFSTERTDRQHEIIDKAYAVAVDFLDSDQLVVDVDYETNPNIFHDNMGMLRDMLLETGI